MIKVSTDAAYNPTTNAAGIGIIITIADESIKLKMFVSDVQDNHIAEFLALIAAINYIKKHFDTQQVITYQSDSKIVVQSLDKEFAKNSSYKELLAYALDIINGFPLFFPKWAPEAQNRGADTLARQALRLEGKVEKKGAFQELDLESF